VHGLTVAQ
jgi:hypothetical protein